MVKPRHEYIVKMGNDVDFDGNIPIASVKELVRCENCTNGRRAGKGVECIYCSVWDYMMPEDGYCHMARKEEEE